ncbi:zinc-binding metallopeptidase family protein [Acetobacter sp.]|uniref:zinc-binding metallopeptidase family protein n=1 Tax=Acetobacter sp. TaxID=440 RepID=UPI0025BE7BD4|nr:putative zinc-binding peptidase [Acetobacter sp.]MCH4090305.1 putative zinc-binding peptidase [Acetobacter sp.]MCI1298999.1 putative zinc-binding peptidase [Acetobacter sp.]MCI1315019.1 putative zinc-binding peptidase [Acetobacter sp.]
MKLFSCQSCGQVLFFENTQCESCGHRLGYCTETGRLLALEASADKGGWLAVGDGAEAPTRFLCTNADYGVCNWLVPEGHTDALCIACRYNHVIPDLNKEGNRELWWRLEQAKHRLFYSLLLLHLPVPTREENPTGGLVFNFPDDPENGDEKVMTGHDEGIITIALREADDAEREKMRVEMGEYYRTLLGHFRHEIGHFYWNVLVRDAGNEEPCRAMFGDHTQDYGAALQQHYENGPPTGWQENYVSSYATTHPWEDFAETWAHYLHIVDTLQTAVAFGVAVSPAVAKDGSLSQTFNFDTYAATSFEELLVAWPPLTVAVNALNRSMGQPDLYPFVITPAIAEKLRFVHDLVHGLPLTPVAPAPQ